MNTDLDDYWTRNYSALETQSEPHLKIQTIKGVEPLDAQFGVADPKTVPDALFVPLFGQPEPTQDALEQAEVDSAKVSPLRTCAILDAAKVAGLPELLAASGLEHRCLFKGNGYDELKDVAPWLVRLEEDNSFTRNLFTRSDAQWHLWDEEPGIYLRSELNLATLASHFRKFTKLQEATGSWRYFRFWEPLTIQAYLNAATQRSYELCPMFYGLQKQMVSSFVCCPVPGDVTIHIAPDNHLPPNGNIGPKLAPDHERMIARAMQRRRQSEIGSALRHGFPDETSTLTDDKLNALVDNVVKKMGHCQIRSVRHIHTFAAWRLIYGTDFENRDPNGYANQILTSSLSEEQKIVHFRKRLDDLHSAGLL